MKIQGRPKLVAALVVPLLAVGCIADGPQLQESTRTKAAELARNDIAKVDQDWQAAVRRALDEGRSRSAATLAGQRAAAAAPVAYLTVLDDEASGEPSAGEIVLPIAVAQKVDGGGGLFADQETVRMCVLLVAPVAPGGTPAVRNLDCPASLPRDVPGLGTVSATVPYS